MIRYLIVEARLAWGYSLKKPLFSKGQPGFSAIPPTTLIGAIAQPIALLSGVGEAINKGGKLYSAAEILRPAFMAASAAILPPDGDHERPSGIYWEDINRYQILQFQRQDRRGLPEFRFGAVPAGKVIAPGSRIIMVYLVNEERARNIIEKTLAGRSIIKSKAELEEILTYAGHSITRIGSKEGIVAVERVEIGEAKPIGREICTRLPHPAEAVEGEPGRCQRPGIEEDLGEWYREIFWEESFEWRASLAPKPYYVPGTKNPIRYSWVRLRLREGFEGYKAGSEEIASFLR